MIVTSRVLIALRRIRKQDRMDEPDFFYVAVYVAGIPPPLWANP